MIHPRLVKPFHLCNNKNFARTRAGAEGLEKVGNPRALSFAGQRVGSTFSDGEHFGIYFLTISRIERWHHHAR